MGESTCLRSAINWANVVHSITSGRFVTPFLLFFFSFSIFSFFREEDVGFILFFFCIFYLFIGGYVFSYSFIFFVSD